MPLLSLSNLPIPHIRYIPRRVVKDVVRDSHVAKAIAFAHSADSVHHPHSASPAATSPMKRGERRYPYPIWNGIHIWIRDIITCPSLMLSDF